MPRLILACTRHTLCPMRTKSNLCRTRIVDRTMTTPSHQVPAVLEIGKTRVFASALDWPGWTRIGHDEATALEALLAYGPRYQRAMRSAHLGFQAPTNLDAFG